MKTYSLREIKDILEKTNADIIGFSLVDYNESIYYEKVTTKLNNIFLYPRNYHVDDYLNINKEIKNARFIISVGLSYNYQKQEDVFYSKINYGIDYHIRIRKLQEDIIKILKELEPNLEYSFSCDTKALDDRYFAYLCGLGFYGKNSMLINKDYGSNVAYGTIITNLKVESFTVDRIKTQCGSCNLCEISCPQQALSNFQLIYHRCLSFLTQSKNIFTYNDDFNSIYGCDICSDVCPYNKNVQTKKSKEPQISLLDFLNLSKKEFKELYQGKSFLWLSQQILKKNALLLKYRNADDNQKIELIELYEKSPSNLIRETISYLKKD